MIRPWKKYVLMIVGFLLTMLMCGCVAAAKETPEIAPPPVEVASEKLDTNRHWIGRASPEPQTIETYSEEVEVIETLDRTKPIYEVYKNGWYVADATAEVQWIIRDLCETYNLQEAELMIYGLVTAESTFVPNLESFDGGCWGLAQINTFWITRANITHFTDDYRSRDLCDPYDNILTLLELIQYAKDEYNLDLTTRAGQIKYLYWHNTGQDPSRVTRWDYATRALGYVDELVTLQS